MSCPASVRVAEAYPEQESSPYAAEGTKAHALGELEASLALGRITERQYRGRFKKWLLTEPVLDDENLADMRSHIAGYVETILERAAEWPDSFVLLEEKVQTGVPHCWGTSDTVIVSPRHVEIIDLKYGMGIPVSAVGNPQLRLYGVGALETFGDVLGETEVVKVTIYQPRLDSVSTEEITADDLRAWRDSLLPIADEALGEDAHFGPSESACRWCPAAGECRARVEKMTQEDFGTDPDTLSVEEIGDLLGRLSEIKAWCAAVEENALRKAYSEGTDIPGWKVVLSGGQRVIVDPNVAAEELVDAGVPEMDLWTEPKLKGLGDLEKLLKVLPKIKPEGATRSRFRKLEDVLSPTILGRTEGKPALVPDSDGRASVNPDAEAAKEFAS